MKLKVDIKGGYTPIMWRIGEKNTPKIHIENETDSKLLSMKLSILYIHSISIFQMNVDCQSLSMCKPH